MMRGGIVLKRTMVSLHSRLNRHIEKMGLNLLYGCGCCGGWEDGVHHAAVYDPRSWLQG